MTDAKAASGLFTRRETVKRAETFRPRHRPHRALVSPNEPIPWSLIKIKAMLRELSPTGRQQAFPK